METLQKQENFTRSEIFPINPEVDKIASIENIHTMAKKLRLAIVKVHLRPKFIVDLAYVSLRENINAMDNEKTKKSLHKLILMGITSQADERANPMYTKASRTKEAFEVTSEKGRTFIHIFKNARSLNFEDYPLGRDIGEALTLLCLDGSHMEADVLLSCFERLCQTGGRLLPEKS